MGFLTKEQKAGYDEQGFIQLNNVFTPEEIEEVSQEYNRLFEAKAKERYDMENTWKGNWAEKTGENAGTTLSIHNLQCHSEVFTRLLLNRNLTSAVSDVIGSPNVLLHHTKAHIKPPGKGSPFPSHQDYPYFPYKKDSMVAAFINLDDSDPENGGLFVFPGSHKLGPLENKSNIPTHYWVDQERFPISEGTPVYAKKGDVLIFSYLTVHASTPNTSDRNRRMLLLQLMSAEDEPLTAVHQSPCQGMVLKGANKNRDADLANSHNTVTQTTTEHNRLISTHNG